MVKLKNILYEILNNYSVELDLFVDKSVSTYDITNEIRAVRGVTIVTIVTPEDYIQKTGSSDEYIRIKMKFITRDEAKEALQRFLDDVLATEKGKGEYRIQGIKSIKFREKTLKRL